MARSRRTPTPLPRLPSPATVPPHVRLAALRVERRLSIAQLAALAGLRPTTISDLERGTTLIPRQRTLAKLAATYGLQLEEFQREVGMCGPLHKAVPRQHDEPEVHTFSPCAEEIAGLVDTLPVHQRQFVLAMCRLLHARQSIDLPIPTLKEEQ
jgi:transcriptional regulator with XRE-family HTH domain